MVAKFGGGGCGTDGDHLLASSFLTQRGFEGIELTGYLGFGSGTPHAAGRRESVGTVCKAMHSRFRRVPRVIEGERTE